MNECVVHGCWWMREVVVDSCCTGLAGWLVDWLVSDRGSCSGYS